MPARTASDGGAPPRRRTLRWTRPRGKGWGVKGENLVHLPPSGGLLSDARSTFQVICQQQQQMFAARRRSVNLEVMRRSVVCAQGLSTCRQNEGVSSFFFLSLCRVASSAVGFEKRGWDGERLQVIFRGKLLDTRVCAHNTSRHSYTHRHRQPAGVHW